MVAVEGESVSGRNVGDDADDGFDPSTLLVQVVDLMGDVSNGAFQGFHQCDGLGML